MTQSESSTLTADSKIMAKSDSLSNTLVSMQLNTREHTMETASFQVSGKFPHTICVMHSKYPRDTTLTGTTEQLPINHQLHFNKS